MFWKIYFWLFVMLSAIFFATKFDIDTLKFSNYISFIYLVSKILFPMILLIVLYALAFKKRVLKRSNWQSLLLLIVLLDFIRVLYGSPLANYDITTAKSIIILIIGLIFILPLYYFPLYYYAYRANDIWTNQYLAQQPLIRNRTFLENIHSNTKTIIKKLKGHR